MRFTDSKSTTVISRPTQGNHDLLHRRFVPTAVTVSIADIDSASAVTFRPGSTAFADTIALNEKNIDSVCTNRTTRRTSAAIDVAINEAAVHDGGVMNVIYIGASSVTSSTVNMLPKHIPESDSILNIMLASRLEGSRSV
jgi:hypothetical protein